MAITEIYYYRGHAIARTDCTTDVIVQAPGRTYSRLAWVYYVYSVDCTDADHIIGRASSLREAKEMIRDRIEEADE